MTKSIIIMCLALATAATGSCNKKPGTATSADGTNANAVKVEFYVMSQCPYGVQVVDKVAPALKTLAGYVDFHLDYIVSPLPDGTFKSLHGQPEVDGNIAQLCAKSLSPKKYMDFVGCQNKDYRKITENWKTCAESTGIDAVALEKCKNGDEGKTLLTASAALAVKRNARGSPTIFVADKPYRGGRGTNDFLRAFCMELKGDKPQPCKDIPEPPKVQVIVLNDKRCKDRACLGASQLINNLKGLFAGLESKNVDYSDKEGKDLYAATGVKHLPAFLFDQNVKKDADGYPKVQRYLKEAGSYLNLAVGSRFDPTSEICDNKADDTGNGKVDCDDDTCKKELVCRKEIPKRLDVFVMSQCPYGVKALDAMKEVIDNFKNDFDFRVNFIAEKTGDGFKALHGQPEVDENIRELCAIKHYPKNYKYMDYILCRNKNIRSDKWQECTGKDTGIATKKIEKCFSGKEGKELLASNIMIAKELGVGASPTWIVNNRHKFSGIDPETIRKNFCQHNPGTKNCDKTLSKQTKVAPGACGAK